MMGHLLSAARARREKSISNDLDARITLDSSSRPEILTSFDKFSGEVSLINKSNPKRIIEVLAVKIWFEGISVTRFKSNRSGSQMINFQHTRFVPMENDLSAVSCDIIKMSDSKEKKRLRFGCHTFPFSLQLTGQVIPSSFQSPYGQIQYRLVLYINIIWGTLLNFAETIKMTTNGCFNLSLDPALSNPLMIMRKNHKSIFSSRPILKANLCLNQSGFLPGESLAFQFEVENTNCENVTKLAISLVQKIVYYANKTKKSTTAQLGHVEYECDTRDGQISWESQIPIPGKLMPSFTSEKKSVEILYFLQFTVDTNGKTGLKGDSLILIGTTRDPRKEESGESGGNPGSSCSKRTFSSAMTPRKNYYDDSVSDTISLASFSSTLPPLYSTLSSRRSSLETLPPPYDEVFAFEDWME